MVQYKEDFKGDVIPFKFEAQYMWNQKIIVEGETIEPDRYHVGHMYYYLSWLKDNVAGDIKPRVNLKDRVTDEVDKAQVGSCILTSSTYHTRSRGPPPPPPPSNSNSKSKGKGKMDDLSGIRKDNVVVAENVETSDGRSTPGQNELVLRLEQKILELQDELEQGYKPPKFEMFDGTGDPKVHLRTYCDKLVGVGKNEQIRMKLFIRSLTGDALSWYISQNPKKWVNWVGMASDFMDRFRFNKENMPDVFYIQNLKKKKIEAFREHATHWRSEAAKVRPVLEEEQMNKFFVRAQDPQYYKRLKAAGCVTLIPAAVVENPSQWINLNKTCAYHSGMKGHTIEECRTLKDKIQKLINTKIIQAKEVAPNVRDHPLPDHRGEGVNVIETDEEWDQEGSIGHIREGDASKTSLVTLTPVVDYIVEAMRKGKAKMEEIGVAQGMTRSGITPENLRGTSKEAAPKSHISILSLLQNSDAHKNTLMKVLSEAYVPTGITSGEMANMVGQVLEIHKITFHEDTLPPERLSHNRALHIIVQFEDKCITRVLIDEGSSLNICPLTTLNRLGKGLHDIRMGSINVKAFDGTQRSTIGEINLDLQMGPTWFDVKFQVLDISDTYNVLLGHHGYMQSGQWLQLYTML
ncbi:uncharacterized protein [Nicotiana tomentosiformis]|uniref:uncharacterized protein n=1 Tax=Nicotiana tomentosiformis TaxID=4098 RepID=UPI00388CB65A